MEKYYFHFGDYYGDGHREYRTVLCESPKSYDELQAIIKKIEFQHPAFQNWDGGLANCYEKPHIDAASWEDIIRLGYPVESFIEKADDSDYSDIKKWEDFGEIEDLTELYINIEVVIDIFVFIMNYYGAELTIVPEEPHNIFTFDYGYGCFYG